MPPLHCRPPHEDDADDDDEGHDGDSVSFREGAEWGCPSLTLRRSSLALIPSLSLGVEGRCWDREGRPDLIVWRMLLEVLEGMCLGLVG